MNEVIEATVTIALAIVGIAALAVLVSSRAQTANIIGVAGESFARSLTAAEAPVLSSSVEFPGQNSFY